MNEIEIRIFVGVTRSYKREWFVTKTTTTPAGKSSVDFPKTFKTKERAEKATRKWAKL